VGCLNKNSYKTNFQADPAEPGAVSTGGGVHTLHAGILSPGAVLVYRPKHKKDYPVGLLGVLVAGVLVEHPKVVGVAVAPVVLLVQRHHCCCNGHVALAGVAP
jgi:hypothetical protein